MDNYKSNPKADKVAKALRLTFVAAIALLAAGGGISSVSASTSRTLTLVGYIVFTVELAALLAMEVYFFNKRWNLLPSSSSKVCVMTTIAIEKVTRQKNVLLTSECLGRYWQGRSLLSRFSPSEQSTACWKSRCRPTSTISGVRWQETSLRLHSWLSFPNILPSPCGCMWAIQSRRVERKAGLVRPAMLVSRRSRGPTKCRAEARKQQVGFSSAFHN